jgi:hypothetical protein
LVLYASVESSYMAAATAGSGKAAAAPDLPTNSFSF